MTLDRGLIDLYQKNDLGKKRLIIEENSNHECVREALEEAFPKLQSQYGAFQVTRCLSGRSGARPLSPIRVGPEGYTVPLLKELSKSSAIYVRPQQEDIVLGINSPVIEEMTKTERLPMVQCISCSKEIQLSVFENHRQQCAPSQRLSKATGHFPVVSKKSFLFPSLQ